MYNKYRFTISIVLLILITITKTGYTQGKMLSVKKQLKDFKHIKANIEAHPDPFTNIPEKEFQEKIEEIEKSLYQPNTTLEFYKKASMLIATLKDGHSSVYLPKKWLLNKRKDNGAFPYGVYLTNTDELYITEHYDKCDIPIRSRIVTINGISIDSFLNIINPYISYELKAFRNTIVDENFEKYLYIAFGSASKTSLTYIKNNTKLTKIVENIPYKVWKKYRKNNKNERDQAIKNKKPYSYEKLRDGISIIKIYSFAIDVKTFRFFLSKTFKKIKKDSIHSLIIDVRGNFGGYPKISSELFHYINDSHFKTMAKSELKISDTFRNYFKKKLPPNTTNNPNLIIHKTRHSVDIDAIFKGVIGTLKIETELYNEPSKFKKNSFDGDCYLLTNRDSYSAASSFAATFQCYQMGVIVGEETGGTKIFRANTLNEKMKNSKIIVSISTTKLFTTCFTKNIEGIKPTIEYSPSILEVISSIDTQLYYTMALIKKVRKLQKAENIK